MTYYTCINNVNNVGAICSIRMSRQKTLKYLGSFFQSPGRPKKKGMKIRRDDNNISNCLTTKLLL